MRFRPSGMTRALKCPGSVAETARLGIADKSSEYAREGTAAHTLAEWSLRFDMNPVDFKGQRIAVFDDDGELLQEFEVTDDMIEAVTIYTDKVRELSPGGEVYFEYRMEAPEIAPEFGGTCDALIVKGTVAENVDYKHGAGVFVDVNNNDQFRSYALLVCEEFPQVETVRAWVVQPRFRGGSNVASITYTRAELDEFRHEIAEAAKTAILCEKADDADKINFLDTGDHCRWCPLKNECPKRSLEVIEMLEEDFGDVAKWTYADWLDKEAAILDFIAQKKQDAKASINAGESVQGWKLVRARANRRWIDDEETVLKALRKRKFKKADLVAEKLRSPAQLEKLCGKDVIADLVHRPETGLSLVRESDRREAVTLADDFRKEG